jgi:TonB family protein
MSKIIKAKILLLVVLFSNCTISKNMGNTSKATIAENIPEERYFILNSLGTFEEIKPIEKPEIYQGKDQFRIEISKTMKYPSISRENGEQGLVMLEATVDETGSITEVKVAKSVSKHLDDEALRTFNVLTGKGYKPYIYNSKAMKFKVQIPFKFKLEG